MCSAQIVEAIKDWIPIIAGMGTCAAAVAAWRSSSKAHHNLELQRQATTYQKVNEILNYRYSPETHKARAVLAKVYDDFLKRDTKIKTMIDLIIHKSASNSFKIEFEKYRYQFIVYFTKLLDLYESGYLKKENMKGLVNMSELHLLFNVSEPYERKINIDIQRMDNDNSGSAGPEKLFSFYRKLMDEGFVGL